MKLFRTYIGGSKKNELTIFSEFYTTKEVNWIKYQKLFDVFSEDYLIVLSARLKLLIILTHVLFILTIIFTLFFKMESIYFILIPFISWCLQYRLNIKKRKIELLNDFTKNIIRREINSLYKL